MHEQFSLLSLQIRKPLIYCPGRLLKFDPVLAILFLSRSQTRLAGDDEFHCAIQFFRCHTFL